MIFNLFRFRKKEIPVNATLEAPAPAEATNDAAGELAAALHFHERLASGMALPTMPPLPPCPGGEAGDRWVSVAVAAVARLGSLRDDRAALEAGKRQLQTRLGDYYVRAGIDYANLVEYLKAAISRGHRPLGWIAMADIDLAARCEIESTAFRETTAHDLAYGRRRAPRSVGVMVDRLSADNRALAELRTIEPVPFQDDVAWSHKRTPVVWLYITAAGQPDPLFIKTNDAAVLTAAARKGELGEVLK